MRVVCQTQVGLWRGSDFLPGSDGRIGRLTANVKQTVAFVAWWRQERMALRSRCLACMYCIVVWVFGKKRFGVGFIGVDIRHGK